MRNSIPITIITRQSLASAGDTNLGISSKNLLSNNQPPGNLAYARNTSKPISCPIISIKYYAKEYSTLQRQLTNSLQVLKKRRCQAKADTDQQNGLVDMVKNQIIAGLASIRVLKNVMRAGDGIIACSVRNGSRGLNWQRKLVLQKMKTTCENFIERLI